MCVPELEITEVVLVKHFVFLIGGTEMKAVSNIFKLQSLFRLPQLLLGLPQQFLMPQGQIQRLFNGLGFMCLATFGEIERED